MAWFASIPNHVLSIQLSVVHYSFSFSSFSEVSKVVMWPDTGLFVMGISGVHSVLCTDSKPWALEMWRIPSLCSDQNSRWTSLIFSTILSKFWHLFGCSSIRNRYLYLPRWAGDMCYHKQANCFLCFSVCTVHLVQFIIQTNKCTTYTGCSRRNGPDFGRVFLRSYYTDITQNTYIQSSVVTEILAREVWNFDSYYSLIDYQIHIETGRNMWFL